MVLFECPTCGTQRPEFGYCYDCTQPLKQITKRRLSPEEKAACTCGRISGRSSLAQQSLLRNLGVPTEKSMNWTKYRASQEIGKRLEKARKGTASPARRPKPETLNPSDGHHLRQAVPAHTQVTNQAVAQGPQTASVTPDQRTVRGTGNPAGQLQDRKEERTTEGKRGTANPVHS